MLRLFIDSSVLFAAVYSSKGRARDLILMATQDKIGLVISLFVIEETRRNLAYFTPDILPALERVFELVDFEIIDATKDDVVKASEVVALKDAPIVAAAKVANVDMLVTLDKKHLLGHPELEDYIGSPIFTPTEAFKRIGQQK